MGNMPILTLCGRLKACTVALAFFLAPNLLAAPSPDASITLLLLDARTAKPISKTSVLLITWDEKGSTRKLGQVTTRKDGTATLLLTEAPPARIGISYSPDELKSCSDIAFSTKQILDVGVVAKNDCDVQKVQTKLQPKPGQLVVFASKISLAERLRREIP
jgi:hypothetical protein